MTEGAPAAAVRTVCEVVRSALGPCGANKLLVQPDGTVTATASSTELLDRLELHDPGTTLLDSAAGSFGDRHGDGTGRFVALTGALLAAAEDLGERGVHPTTIERGYRAGLDAALDAVERTERPLSSVGPAAVARTALTGTRDPRVRRTVADRIAETVAATGPAAVDDVRVLSKTGGSTAETDLVEGTVLDRGPVLDAMPRTVEGGVAVLSSTVDVPRLGGDEGPLGRRVVLEADSFEDRAALADGESAAFERRLSAAVGAGCRAVVTERSINERVQSALAAEGILGLQRVDAEHARAVARETGATAVPSLDRVDGTTIGRGRVAVRRKAGRDVTVVEGGGETRTLFCRAPDPRSTAAFEASVEGALAATAAAVEDGRVVPGGGAVEATAAGAVRDATAGIDGRHRLAATAYGRALTRIPRALGRTAGLDGARTVIRLRVARSEGRDAVGVDVLAGTVGDVLGEEPVVDPPSVVRAVLREATEAAIGLARIDERLPAADLSEEPVDPPDAVPGPEPGEEAD